MPTPRMLMILSENWTKVLGRRAAERVEAVAVLHAPLHDRAVRLLPAEPRPRTLGPERQQVVRDAMAAAGRDIAELEMVGGIRYRLPDDHSLADLGESMDSIPEQLEQGFTTICIKPSMYIDDASEMEAFCKDVMKRAEAMG